MQKVGVGRAGILNSAVGTMREAPGFGLAIGDGDLEAPDGKACSEMRIQRPSDHPAAKRVKHNGKESNPSRWVRPYGFCFKLN